MVLGKDDVEAELEEAGELLVTLDSGEKVELHLHDTEFGDNGVTVELADGEFSFPYDVIESTGIHLQETSDLYS
jgi:hypothetical protein